MRVHFWIPGPLRSMTAGRGHVDVETSGGTLQDALEALFAAHPAIRDRILTERGEVRQHVSEKVKRAGRTDWRRPWRTAWRFRSFRPSAAGAGLGWEGMSWGQGQAVIPNRPAGR
jgi:hypothetical protein